MNETKCMWCKEVIPKPREGQKVCCARCPKRQATLADIFARFAQESQQRQMEELTNPPEIGS